MTRIQCPQDNCINWAAGLCTSDEIELEMGTLSCITFEEAPDEQIAENHLAGVGKSADDADEELDWVDDDSLIEDELDERFYENSALDMGLNLDEDDLYSDNDDDDFDEFEEAGFEEESLEDLRESSSNRRGGESGGLDEAAFFRLASGGGDW